MAFPLASQHIFSIIEYSSVLFLTSEVKQQRALVLTSEITIGMMYTKKNGPSATQEHRAQNEDQYELGII